MWREPLHNARQTRPLSGNVAGPGHCRLADNLRFSKELMSRRPERAIRHAYEPLSGTWTQASVVVLIEDQPFDEGAMRVAVCSLSCMTQYDSCISYFPNFCNERKQRSFHIPSLRASILLYYY